ncbi:F0F1 ATP synthase subunit B [Sulfurospirillum deleyianum]|uniref:ATP synthase subunit b n=1 Tax=Sulfurospirillum deleyianum (strain ATCC 51133 / DSM 6946 / 5175) TaxID=525898 RepID=D1AZT1_SULD5|nr:F0F1 ATP synthase subunit B [Sulfurospirillum deleyianum]ACZ11548.1 H+transporting two-sector ATPase B/B' subunit [Sulfurospirillum deleyianum DSM 6946]
MKINYFLLLLTPIALLASGGEGSGGTDIFPRTVNFLIFVSIMYYYVANDLKAWYVGRKNEIATKLDSIQVKLKESNSKKEIALAKVEEAKVNAKNLIETAKKEAVLLTEKIAQEADAELSNLEKAFQDRMAIEQRRMQREIISNVLDEMFKEGSITLGDDEMVKIVNKKVA